MQNAGKAPVSKAKGNFTVLLLINRIELDFHPLKNRVIAVLSVL